MAGERYNEALEQLNLSVSLASMNPADEADAAEALQEIEAVEGLLKGHQEDAEQGYYEEEVDEYQDSTGFD